MQTAVGRLAATIGAQSPHACMIFYVSYKMTSKRGQTPSRLTCLLSYCKSKAINDFTHLDAIIAIVHTHLLRKSGHSKPAVA